MVIEDWLGFKISKYNQKTLWLVESMSKILMPGETVRERKNREPNI